MGADGGGGGGGDLFREEFFRDGFSALNNIEDIDLAVFSFGALAGADGCGEFVDMLLLFREESLPRSACRDKLL